MLSFLLFYPCWHNFEYKEALTTTVIRNYSPQYSWTLTNMGRFPKIFVKLSKIEELQSAMVLIVNIDENIIMERWCVHFWRKIKLFDEIYLDSSFQAIVFNSYVFLKCLSMFIDINSPLKQRKLSTEIGADIINTL